MMWILFTEGAALCIAFAAVMTKAGMKQADYALGVTLVGSIFCIMSFFTSVKPITLHAILKLTPKVWIFLILTGITTGGAMIYFFKSLQAGKITKVVPILKLNLLYIVLIKTFILKKQFDINKIVATVLIIIGCAIIVIGAGETFQWMLYAFIASLLLCAVSFLHEIGLAKVNSGLERFIVLIVAIIMFWVVLFVSGGPSKFGGINFVEGVELVLAGVAAAFSYSFYDQAIALTKRFNIEAVYRFDILLLIVLAGLFTDEKPTGKAFCGSIVFIMGLEVLLLKAPLTTIIK